MKKISAFLLVVTVAIASVSFGQTTPVDLNFKNDTKYRISVLDGPFAELALPDSSISKHKYSVPQGMIQFSVLVDLDGEGKHYQQTVISRIITEQDKVFVLNEKNLSLTKGKKTGIRLVSTLPYKIVFVGGPFDGVALSEGIKRSGKKDRSPGRPWYGRIILTYGFNSFAVQYFDVKGIKMQANVELIITREDRVLEITPTDIKNAKAVEGSYSVKK